MFCEYCGKKIPSDASFCEYCGHATKEVNNVELEEEKTDNQLIDEKYEKEETVSFHKKSPSKKNNKIFLMLFICLLVLLGGGIGWNKWGFQKTNHEVEKTSETVTKKDVATSATKEKDIPNSKETAKEKKSEVDKGAVSKIANDTIETLGGTNGIYIMSMDKEETILGKNENSPIKAASLIKLFLMESFYKQVQDGTLSPNDTYQLKETDQVGGTGELQYAEVGKQYTYEELIQAMIKNSDNSAGNIIMTTLGGPKIVTRYLHNQGYENTRIERQFVDSNALSEGYDNYTSAKDVGLLLKNLYQNKVTFTNYDQQMLDMLLGTTNRSKLPKLLDETITVYNKTGEYTDYGVQNDACILEKNKQAYIVVVLSENGEEAQQIKEMNEFGSSLASLFWEGN